MCSTTPPSEDHNFIVRHAVKHRIDQLKNIMLASENHFPRARESELNLPLIVIRDLKVTIEEKSTQLGSNPIKISIRKSNQPHLTGDGVPIQGTTAPHIFPCYGKGLEAL